MDHFYQQKVQDIIDELEQEILYKSAKDAGCETDQEFIEFYRMNSEETGIALEMTLAGLPFRLKGYSVIKEEESPVKIYPLNKKIKK